MRMGPGVLLALALSPKICQNGFRTITFPKDFLHAAVLVWRPEELLSIDVATFVPGSLHVPRYLPFQF